jgi:hypothetical protein
VVTYYFHRRYKDGKTTDDWPRETEFIISQTAEPRIPPLVWMSTITVFAVSAGELETWSDFLYETLVGTFGLRSVIRGKP